MFPISDEPVASLTASAAIVLWARKLRRNRGACCAAHRAECATAEPADQRTASRLKPARKSPPSRQQTQLGAGFVLLHLHLHGNLSIRAEFQLQTSCQLKTTSLKRSGCFFAFKT